MDQTTTTIQQRLDSREIVCDLGENISECLMIDSAKQNASIAQNNEETYWQRSLGFLIIGIIGILANGFVIIILGSSVKN